VLGSATVGPRAEVIARYRPALALPADRGRGEKVFERECFGCHRLGERGQAVGPNLASVARRTPEEILTHVLDPNREVAPDFLEYVVALKDGRVASGLIVTETATGVTLRRAQGAEETVLRRDIDSIASTGKSLMPEGLEAQVKPQEMADLLAFLLDLQK
jgi:putative heme-binding domain-containing protein